MAQVIISMEEYKNVEKRLSAVSDLKLFVRQMAVFIDNGDCWNTEQDVVRAFTLPETKEIIKQILNL